MVFQVQGIARGGGVLASLGCVWAVGVVGVLLFAGEDTVMPGSGSRIVAMQQGGLQRAIAGLNSEDRRSKQMLKSGFRTSQLASADDGLNWLEKIQGKDTTHDLDYIKSLPAGDVSVAGYEGLPKMKGMLPSEHEMASADALLKRAIDSKTMPTDVTNVWDGKPYEPSPEFNQKITDSFALFHAALGEKKWDKMVSKCTDAAHCEPLLQAKHEGYQTKWDGKEWTQFDGEDWKPLEHDSLV